MASLQYTHLLFVTVPPLIFFKFYRYFLSATLFGTIHINLLVTHISATGNLFELLSKNIYRDKI